MAESFISLERQSEQENKRISNSKYVLLEETSAPDVTYVPKVWYGILPISHLNRVTFAPYARVM